MATPAHERALPVDPTKRHYTLVPPVADVTGPRPLATIVLPCYNAAGHVVRELERITHAMDTSGLTYELLVVDDASTDSSPRLLEEALPRFPRMRLMPFRRNGGAGTARRVGTSQARGELVVWADVDLGYPNERIPELVRYLVEHPECAQVVGARQTERRRRSVLRAPGGWLVRRVAERIAGVPIPDLDSGMRAFRREVSLPSLRLLPPRHGCGGTIALAFLCRQHDVHYLPIEYVAPSLRPARRPVRAVCRGVVHLTRLVVCFDPIKMLLPQTAVVFLLGVAAAAGYAIAHSAVLLAAAVFALLAGLLVGALAVLADLVVRCGRQ